MAPIIILLKQLIKNKYFWYALSIITIGFLAYQLFKKTNKANVLEHNLSSLNKNINVLKTKNNELYYSVDGLTLERGDLKRKNNSLYSEIKSMKIKEKNIQSIIEMRTSYAKTYKEIPAKLITMHDTIFIPYVDSVATNSKTFVKQYKFEQIESDNQLTGTINIPTQYNFDTKTFKLLDTINPYLSDVNMKISDSLLIVPTINYKRVWLFFRRPQSISVFVKSRNKMFNLEQLSVIKID